MRHVPSNTSVALVAALAGSSTTGLMTAGCDSGSPTLVAQLSAVRALEPEPDPMILQNPSAAIPPQCYIRTQDDAGQVHNPCYVCHGRPQRPTYVEDDELQLAYDFPALALDNPWTNLFVDRREAAAAIGDEVILDYVRRDNYQREGRLLLAETLADPRWDRDRDGRFSGYVPDAHFDFDEAGFDRAPDGSFTGWRAYAFYPLPGAFLPTNGSAGDALIRLPVAFRQAEDGTEDELIYAINLAIVEALIKRRDVALPEAVDEARLKVDLDRDGRLGEARRVTFDWAPREGRDMAYVGRARDAQALGELHLAAGLFPEGTELLHSVRYLDVDGDEVVMAPRFKELRYAKKTRWLTYADLELAFAAEERERRESPDRLELVHGDTERGVDNGQGWLYQGFIEDAAGDLRPQTYEESVYCVGCHGGLSVTSDGTFSFARKLDAEAPRGGWFHWTQRGLRGLPEPRTSDGGYEYSRYLERNGAADDLRQNHEAAARFFEGDALRPDAIEALHEDVASLLLPSPSRALQLDEVYRLIVVEQSFIRGRDATLSPMDTTVHRRVAPGSPTGISEPLAR
ncbi:MAG: hypothetical protein KC731_14450 [Myxococcales bacterium]|nr:hypothetical protein [Myxococcales bacterium]